MGFYVAFLMYVAEDKIYPGTLDLVCQDAEKSSQIWGNNCQMRLLGRQQATLLFIYCLTNAMELGLPVLHTHLVQVLRPVASGGARRDLSGTVGAIDRATMIPQYGTPDCSFDGTMDDYSEIAVLMGFLLFFSIAFPLAGFVVFLSMMLEVWVDSLKVRKLVRRPIPVIVMHIGVWKTIFSVISWIAIPINAALIAYTARLPGFIPWGAEDPIAGGLLIMFELCVVRLLVTVLASYQPWQMKSVDARLQLVLDRLRAGTGDATEISDFFTTTKRRDRPNLRQRADFRVRRPQEWGTMCTSIQRKQDGLSVALDANTLLSQKKKK